MLFTKFKCPQCGAEFKQFGLFLKPGSTKQCPNCGYEQVHAINEDAVQKRIEEKSRCDEHG